MALPSLFKMWPTKVMCSPRDSFPSSPTVWEIGVLEHYPWFRYTRGQVLRPNVDSKYNMKNQASTHARTRVPCSTWPLYPFARLQSDSVLAQKAHACTKEVKIFVWSMNDYIPFTFWVLNTFRISINKRTSGVRHHPWGNWPSPPRGNSHLQA